MQKYEYRAIDHSILTPCLKKYLVRPLLSFVPFFIPANVITFISFSFVLAAFCCSFFINLNAALIKVSVAICMFFYLLFDHMDGMQAKRTKTSSPLGEFCDHYLDIFATGVLTASLLNTLGEIQVEIFVIGLTSCYFFHTATMFEQFQTGWIRFDKIGPVESIVATISILLLCSVSIFDNFFHKTVWGDLNLLEALFLATSILTTISAIKVLIRLRIITISFCLYIISLISMCLYCLQNFNIIQTVLLFSLYHGVVIGNYIKGHLIDKVERYPDMIIVLFILLQIWSPSIQNSHLWGLLFFYAAYVTYLTATVFLPLKKYWVWRNDPLTQG